MPDFHRAGKTQINVFQVEETYLFKHYFTDEGVFEAIKRYYNQYEYRFEVPSTRFQHVREVLDRHGYDLTIVDSRTEFAVVKRKYTNHPDVLFKDSVIQRSLGNFNIFVMKDRDAVEKAVMAGARRITETDLDFTGSP